MSSRFFLCVPGLFSHSSTRHHADPILRLPRPDLTGAVKRGPHVRGRQAMATAATTTSSTATTTTTTCSSPSSTTSPIHPAVPHRRRLNDIERVDYAHGAAADDCAACGGVAPDAALADDDECGHGTRRRGRHALRRRRRAALLLARRKRAWVIGAGGQAWMRASCCACSASSRSSGSWDRTGEAEVAAVAVAQALAPLAAAAAATATTAEARQEGGGGRRRRDGVDGGEPDGSHAPPARPAGAYVHSPLITRSTLTSLDRHSFITKII